VIDRDALFKARLPERTIELDGVGEIRVRALSRGETTDIPSLEGIEREAVIISRAMVEPIMSRADVIEWMAAAPAGEFDKISTAIGELSGLLESSGKDAYKSAGPRSDA